VRSSNLFSLFKRIKLLFLDVDGVLTDGGIWVDGEGRELAKFDVQDGKGIVRAQEKGLIVAFVTAKQLEATKRRADTLGVKEVWLGVKEKAEIFETLRRRYSLSSEEIAAVGDDLQDLPVMERAGLAVAVANARPEVKAVAHYITQARGGQGAIRELVELILEARR